MLTPGITFSIIGVAGAVLAREMLCSPGMNIIANMIDKQIVLLAILLKDKCKILRIYVSHVQGGFFYWSALKMTKC